MKIISNIYKNTMQVLRNPKFLLGYLILVAVLGTIWYLYTDFTIILGNYGKLHGYTDITLSWLTIIFFPLFIVSWIYRATVFGAKNKKDWASFIGGIVSVIISGSSCCGLSLAMFFGLTPLMQLLPFSGLEIKVVATILLLIGLFNLLANLLTCKMKVKQG